MAIKPTTTEMRADTRISWATLGLPDPTPDPDTALSEEIDVAYVYVEEKTGRDLDTMVDTSNLGILAKRAVKLRTIQQAVQDRSSFLTREIDRQIKSFSVPGYSETRESATALSGKTYPAGLLNDWPILNDLLWTLATPAKRDEALALFHGEESPASAIVGVGWTDRRPPRWPLMGDPFFHG